MAESSFRPNRWRVADYWLRVKLDGLTLDELLAKSEVVTVGIDGGGLDDMLGLAVLGRAEGSLEWLFWNHGNVDATPEL